jgi:hypothetical protein
MQIGTDNLMNYSSQDGFGVTSLSWEECEGSLGNCSLIAADGDEIGYRLFNVNVNPEI